MIHLSSGDIIYTAKNRETNIFNIIVHGANCLCTMGSGFAKQIKESFPEAWVVDMQTQKGDYRKMGTISYSFTGYFNKRPIIVNAYTQYGHNPVDKPFEYGAFRSCLKEIKNHFDKNITLGMPMIGAGLGGGNWDIIKDIIEEEIDNYFDTIIIVEEYIPNKLIIL